MRKFIEWTEGDKSRGRKVVLFSTVMTFLIITLVLFGAAIWGVIIAEATTTLYMTLVSLMVAIYGFYTGTSSKKPSVLADKTAEIIIKKLDEAAKAEEEVSKKDDPKSE